MNVPASIKSALKMALYLAIGAFVSYFVQPGVLEKMGMPSLFIGVAISLLKGIMTLVTTGDNTK
jgi:hypothetical protein